MNWLRTLLMFAVAMIATACQRISPPPQPPSPLPLPSADFFPSATGTSWSYEITVSGKAHPLVDEIVSWPLSNGQRIDSTGRRLLSDRSPSVRQKKPNDPPDLDFLREKGLLIEEPKPGKTYVLEISVKGPAQKQGALEYPKGVELRIAKDDLGIFEGHEQVFWAISDSSDRVLLVVNFSPKSRNAPRSTAAALRARVDGAGSADRLVYFSDQPGTELGPKGSADRLMFKGIDQGVEGHPELECAHFVRSVTRNPGGDPEFSKGFSEDVWYGRNKGLVRVEQKIEGVTSMTWTLKTYSVGLK